MDTRTLRNDTDLHRILAIAAAVFAAAGGLIHLTVTRQHLDFAIVAAGFVFMGVAQWVFALTILKRPTTVIAISGGVLHAAIVTVWILSRTIGLAFVPGAEHVAPVGVTDIVATSFSVAVVGTAVMWRALSGSTVSVNVPYPGFRTVAAVLAIGALFLTVPALAAPHDHVGSHVSTDTAEVHPHEAETPGTTVHHHETEHQPGVGG
ncbi:MAG TPA: hypothetical protein VF115_12570 [Acidimicrobiia bacterium]